MNVAAPRYRAFLSYSHRDAALVARLHRRLETYVVPRSLRGPAVPARIHPVFRDRDELASAGQLSCSIEEALDASAALVVVCSPAAVASPWVNAEIAYFRRHHPDRAVLAFVVAGDPGADPRTQPQHAAFPASLVLEDPDRPDGGLVEPLAADAREEADGFSAAFLKLAAGLLGVRYDQLRRRDQRRRQRRWAIAAAGSALLAAVFAFLAWQATVARDAARAAQGVAELELRSERETREFLLSVFTLADAGTARGDRVTVREVLDRAVQRIDRAQFSRPAIRARYLATMGQAYSSLGLNKRSTELLQQSLALLRDAALDREAVVQRIDSRLALSDTLFDMGEYENALNTLAALEHGPERSAASLAQRALAASIRGDVFTYLERDADALQAFTEAQQLLDAAALSKEERETARVRSVAGMATLALFAGDAARAQAGFAQALDTLERILGADHPRAIATRGSLGAAAYRNGDRDAAREAWSGALTHATTVYDPDGPVIGSLKSNLGLLLLEDGDLDGAEPLLRAALESDRKHRGEAFDDLAYPLHNLGYLLLLRGQRAEARTLLDEGLAIAEASSHRMLGPMLNALADLDCSEGALERGTARAERSLALAREAGEADAWRAAQAEVTLAACRARAGMDLPRPDKALEQLRTRWSKDSPFVRRAQAQLRAP